MSFLDRIREFTARPNLTSGAVERARHGRQAQTAQVGLMTGVIQTMANHATILAALWRLTKSVTTTERLIAAAVAALATLLFYGESFANHSLSAGFLYTADCWNVWLPQIAKVISLVQHGAFSGIDFSTHGGASEFFIRAGLYPYHPLVLLYSVLARSASLEGLMRFTVTMLAVHSFLGCYFAVRLGTRYLKLRMGAAIFVAVGFSFSQQIVTAIGFCPFFLSTALVPWAIYSGLVHIDRPSIRQALLCSVPIFLTFLGGYSVMAFSSICLSWAFVAIYVFTSGSALTLFVRD